MRLIDADALAKTLGITDTNCRKCHRGIKGFCMMGADFMRACAEIEAAPTVDAVEVVRCKDCKLFDSDMEWCEADDEHPTRPDAFCSWAERRDG